MITYAQFNTEAGLDTKEICRHILSGHRASIKAKKEKTALKNLQLIYEATLKIGNQKGFQAMTMRDLSRETGLSMGALYDYFPSKEELLEMVQSTGRAAVSRVLDQALQEKAEPWERLCAGIRTHLFVSESMRSWFYFSYMETRHLGKTEKDKAIAGEQHTDRLFADIIIEGQKEGIFRPLDPSLAALAVKSMLQDWYVKRGKYAKQGLTVDAYSRFIIDFVKTSLLTQSPDT